MKVWKLVGVVVEVVCLQDPILKVSGRYLNYWLSCKGSLIKLLTVGREKREREGPSDFSGCLAIATVGQKATVGQGLPNSRQFLKSQPSTLIYSTRLISDKLTI